MNQDTRLWVVYSNREGVSEMYQPPILGIQYLPTKHVAAGHEYKEISYQVRFCPFQFKIKNGKTSCIKQNFVYGQWESTYFASTNIEEVYEWMDKESERIWKEYISLLPKVYVVITEKDKVLDPFEIQTLSISHRSTIMPDDLKMFLYKFCGIPYELDFIENETKSHQKGYGEHQTYGFLSEGEAIKYYNEECERVSKEYLNGELINKVIRIMPTA